MKRRDLNDNRRGPKRAERTITCHICRRLKPTGQFPRAGGKARGRGREHDVSICQRCISRTPKKKLIEIMSKAKDARYPSHPNVSGNYSGPYTSADGN